MRLQIVVNCGHIESSQIDHCKTKPIFIFAGPFKLPTDYGNNFLQRFVLQIMFDFLPPSLPCWDPSFSQDLLHLLFAVLGSLCRELELSRWQKQFGKQSSVSESFC